MQLFPNEPAKMPVLDAVQVQIALAALKLERIVWPGMDWATLQDHFLFTPQPLTRLHIEQMATALTFYAALMGFPAGEGDELRARLPRYEPGAALGIVALIFTTNGHVVTPGRIDQALAQAQHLLRRELRRQPLL